MIRVLEPAVSEKITFCITEPEDMIPWRVGEYLRRHGEPDFDPNAIPLDDRPTYLLLATLAGLRGRIDARRWHRTAFEQVRDRTPDRVPGLGKLFFGSPSDEIPDANQIRKSLLLYRTAYVFLHRRDETAAVLSNPYGTPG